MRTVWLRIARSPSRRPLLGREVADVWSSFILDGLMLEVLRFRFYDVVVVVTHNWQLMISWLISRTGKSAELVYLNYGEETII